MFGFKGRTIVVTGAKQGIGYGIANAFAKSGAKVVLSDIDETGVTASAQAIAKATKAKTMAIGADVSDPDAVQDLFEAAEERFGPPDALVNNAGIYPFKPFLDMTLQDWRKVQSTNLESVFLCTQAASRRMAEKGGQKTGGKIVNVASIAGLVGYAGLTHYCASKGGILSFTRAAALELAPYGINVNAIAPGPIRTPGVGNVDAKTLSGIVAAIPKKRMGTPEDVASAALYLASDEADFVTGQVLVVDGGNTIQ